MFSKWSWDRKRKSILDGFRRVVVNCREFAFRITRQHVVERQRKDVCANWLWRARLTGPACNAGFYDPKSAALYSPTRRELRGRRHQIGRGAFSVSAFGA